VFGAVYWDQTLPRVNPHWRSRRSMETTISTQPAEPEWQYAFSHSGASGQPCGSPEPRFNFFWQASATRERSFTTSSRSWTTGTQQGWRILSSLLPCRIPTQRCGPSCWTGCLPPESSAFASSSSPSQWGTDRKPFQFLRHLRSLAPDVPDVPDDFLRTIWTRQLPREVQTTLAAQPDVELDTAARSAGRITEATARPALPSID
jgi:hypothetical protein